MDDRELSREVVLRLIWQRGSLNPDACDKSLDAHDLALREKVERLERERDSAKADLRLACQDVESLRLERDESQHEAWANWNSFTRSQTEVERLTKERDEARTKADKTFALHQKWLEAGQKAGFVFSCGKVGFQMEHNPILNAELAALCVKSDAQDAERAIRHSLCPLCAAGVERNYMDYRHMDADGLLSETSEECKATPGDVLSYLLAELKLARDHWQGYEADCRLYESNITDMQTELQRLRLDLEAEQNRNRSLWEENRRLIDEK
jgi:hypothetical protein